MQYIKYEPNISRYITSLEKATPLSKKEEVALFTLYRKGNNTAKKKLILANLRFVFKVALRYRGQLPLPDLINEGNMGLIHALEKYEPARNLRFISYAIWHIRAYINRAIAEQGSLIHIPFNKRLEMKKGLKAEGKGKGQDKEAQALHHINTSIVRLDEMPDTFDIEDTNIENPEETVNLMGISVVLKACLDTLPAREKQVLEGLFGLNGLPPKTLREVGEELGISHERIRQIRDRAIEHLRKTHVDKLSLLHISL